MKNFNIQSDIWSSTNASCDPGPHLYHQAAQWEHFYAGIPPQHIYNEIRISSRGPTVLELPATTRACHDIYRPIWGEFRYMWLVACYNVTYRHIYGCERGVGSMVTGESQDLPCWFRQHYKHYQCVGMTWTASHLTPCSQKTLSC